MHIKNGIYQQIKQNEQKPLILVADERMSSVHRWSISLWLLSSSSVTTGMVLTPLMTTLRSRSANSSTHTTWVDCYNNQIAYEIASRSQSELLFFQSSTAFNHRLQTGQILALHSELKRLSIPSNGQLFPVGVSALNYPQCSNTGWVSGMAKYTVKKPVPIKLKVLFWRI